jgi:hypothetical protein
MLDYIFEVCVNIVLYCRKSVLLCFINLRLALLSSVTAVLFAFSRCFVFALYFVRPQIM